MTTQVVTGDDVLFSVQLYKDGEAFVIDPGATVEAMFVSLDRTTVYTAAIAQSSGATGADWATATVVVSMADTVTSAVTYQGRAYLAIQVDDTIKESFYGPVVIMRGNIP